MFLLNSILSKRARTLISYICCFQMIFAPMASHAQQAEVSRQPASTVARSTKSISQPFTKVDVEGFLKATGLNRSHLTYGEFYKNISQFVPADALKELAPWFKQNSKGKMPKVSVSTFKDKDSKTKYRLTLSEGKIVRTFTLYGETENIIQYGNMPMAQADIFSVSDVAKKIYAVDRHARDPKVEEQINYRAMTWKPAPQDPNQYTGSFVLPTYEHYKKMTPYQRAEFIVRTRELWVAGKQAEFMLNKKKIASLEIPRFNDFFMQALLGQTAEAKSETISGKTFYTGAQGECIDSGYAGKFSAKGCISPAVKQEDIESFGAPGCKSICNPLIYGLNSNGKAHCSVKGNRQIATHWEGPCDSAARLSSEKYILDNDINPNKLNLDDPKSQEALVKKLEGSIAEEDIKKHTQALLQSMMSGKSSNDKINNSEINDFFDGKNSNEEFQKRFSTAVQSFYSEIAVALNACSTFDFGDDLLKKGKVLAKDDGSQQLNACRQLWRRKLAFDIGLGQICKSAAKSDKSETGCVGFAPKPELIASCDGDATRVETSDPQPLSTPNPNFKSTIREKLKSDKPERTEATPQVTVKCKCSTGVYVNRGEKCGAGPIADSSTTNPGRCGVPDDQITNEANQCICKSTGFEPRIVNGKKTCGDEKASGDFDADTKCLSGQGIMVWMSCNKNWLVPLGTALIVGGALWWLKSRANAKDKATDVCPTGWQTCPGQYGTVGTECTSPATWSVTLQKCYTPCGPNEVPNLTTNPTKCDPVSTVVSKMNSYACWNGQTVANEILCPKYECPDGSRVANPTLCSSTGNQKMQKSIYDIEK